MEKLFLKEINMIRFIMFRQSVCCFVIKLNALPSITTCRIKSSVPPPQGGRGAYFLH